MCQFLGNATGNSTGLLTGSLDASKTCSATNGVSGQSMGVSQAVMVLVAPDGAGVCQPGNTTDTPPPALGASGGMVLNLNSASSSMMNNMGVMCMHSYSTLVNGTTCSWGSPVPRVTGLAPMAAYQATQRTVAGSLFSAQDMAITATALSGWPVLSSTTALLYANQASNAFLMTLDLPIPGDALLLGDVLRTLQQWRGLSIKARVLPDTKLPAVATELVLLQAPGWDASNATWLANLVPPSSMALPNGYVISLRGQGTGMVENLPDGSWVLRLQVGGMLYGGFTRDSWAWWRQWCASPLPGQAWSFASFTLPASSANQPSWSLAGSAVSMAVPPYDLVMPGSRCMYRSTRWFDPLTMRISVTSQQAPYTLQQLLDLQANGSLAAPQLTMTASYPDGLSAPMQLTMSLASAQLTKAGTVTGLGTVQLQRPCANEQLKAKALLVGQLASGSKGAGIEGSIIFSAFEMLYPANGMTSTPSTMPVGGDTAQHTAGPAPGASTAPAGPDAFSAGGTAGANISTTSASGEPGLGISLVGSSTTCMVSPGNSFLGCSMELSTAWDSGFISNVTRVSVATVAGDGSWEVQLQVANFSSPARLAEQLSSLQPELQPAQLCSASVSGVVALKSSKAVMPVANGTVCLKAFIEDTSGRRLPLYTTVASGPLQLPADILSGKATAAKLVVSLDVAALGGGVWPQDAWAARAAACKQPSPGAVPTGELQQGSFMGQALAGMVRFTSSVVTTPGSDEQSCGSAMYMGQSSGWFTASLAGSLKGEAPSSPPGTIGTFNVSSVQPGAGGMLHQLLLVKQGTSVTGNTTSGLLAVRSVALCGTGPSTTTYGTYSITQSSAQLTGVLQWGGAMSGSCSIDPLLPSPSTSGGMYTVAPAAGPTAATAMPGSGSTGMLCQSSLASMLPTTVSSGAAAGDYKSPVNATVQWSGMQQCSTAGCAMANATFPAVVQQWLTQSDMGLVIGTFVIDLASGVLPKDGMYSLNTTQAQSLPWGTCTNATCPAFAAVSSVSPQQVVAGAVGGGDAFVSLGFAVPGASPALSARFNISCWSWGYYGGQLSVGALSGDTYSAPTRVCSFQQSQLTDPVSGRMVWLNGQRAVLSVTDKQLVVSMWLSSSAYLSAPVVQPQYGYNNSYPVWSSPMPGQYSPMPGPGASPAPYMPSSPMPGSAVNGSGPSSQPIPSPMPYPTMDQSTGSPDAPRSWTLPASLCGQRMGQLTWGYLNATSLGRFVSWDAATTIPSTLLLANVTSSSVQEAAAVQEGDGRLVGTAEVRMAAPVDTPLGLNSTLLWLDKLGNSSSYYYGGLMPLPMMLSWASYSMYDMYGNRSTSAASVPWLAGHLNLLIQINTSAGATQQVYLTGSTAATAGANGGRPTQLSFSGQYVVPPQGIQSVCAGNWSIVKYVQGFITLTPTSTTSTARLGLQLYIQRSERIFPTSPQPYYYSPPYLQPGVVPGPRSSGALRFIAGMQAQNPGQMGPAPPGECWPGRSAGWQPQPLQTPACLRHCHILSMPACACVACLEPSIGSKCWSA